MSVLERLKQRTRQYQDQYRKERGMLTDDQIEAMGRKLASSFLDYFKSQYGPAPADKTDSLHQKIDVVQDAIENIVDRLRTIEVDHLPIIFRQLGDHDVRRDDHVSRFEDLDEKFGMELDKIKERLVVTQEVITEIKQHSMATRQLSEEEHEENEERIEEFGKQFKVIKEELENLRVYELDTRKWAEEELEAVNGELNHTRAVAEEAEKEYVGVKAYESGHGLAEVVERLTSRIEKLEKLGKGHPGIGILRQRQHDTDLKIEELKNHFEGKVIAFQKRLDRADRAAHARVNETAEDVGDKIAILESAVHRIDQAITTFPQLQQSIEVLSKRVKDVEGDHIMLDAVRSHGEAVELELGAKIQELIARMGALEEQYGDDAFNLEAINRRLTVSPGIDAKLDQVLALLSKMQEPAGGE